MDHLLSSRATVLRATTIFSAGGIPTRAWTEVYTGVKLRLDLHAKALMTGAERSIVEAGTKPDLVGICFMNPNTDVSTGDRIRITSGPHEGRTFSVEDTPAQTVGYATVHHLEWAITEVSNNVT